mgnify:CR=1 FL=1
MIQKLKQLLFDPAPDDLFPLTLILVGLTFILVGLDMVLR